MGNGTSIGRVRGLGSAHEGAHHWLVQRFADGTVFLEGQPLQPPQLLELRGADALPHRPPPLPRAR